ncbi:valyl-tRNA synthetase, putative [Ichthyophthirius multifiliis]|uniref:Valine--tRNA ligase, mitochondrial n=1 Tax=Ichthyophthirius multifiliis TaxID=5932 RepID=G0QJ59_ICHMU|nr:valyl-tRNA synthetase, putative [Ichthyophthirius multifiliis]EGR34740.1 valyl-tRNA synthetase, putative [Ichthyophthirius multifiliis]|eukprot:XP_004040044.1 valyl-tRNA synthetase, putative [Ichthyophthirius multifiliis]
MKTADNQTQKPIQEQPLEQAIAQKRKYEDMLKAYEPKTVEQNWMKYWENQKFFHANPQNVLNSSKKAYAMVIPPPNVTGYLHIGHGLTSAVEDSIIRRKRMQGYETLYLPGVDHAGIATHTVVEKQLMKEEGKTRHDIGRDAFVQKIWTWKEKHGNVITNQLRKVGSSLDWDRFHFTMDDQLSIAVKEAFVRLSEKGLIYRSNRLVNWSCALKTAISDVEVTHEKIEEPILKAIPGHTGKYEFGVLIHFSYKIKENPSQEIIVATTRIETMLGDVAVAVHPDDKRYQHLIGKELIHPFIPERKLIVIADAELVQMDFGTGAVKITPAHDPNDYLCGERHNLPKINLFDDYGIINENGGPYKGLKRFDCRNKIVEDLQKIGQYKDKSKNPMSIGLCQRSGDVIEPLLRPQWYIKCTDIAKRMCDVVENGELKIHPQGEFDKNWFQFMRNPQDWCISRQLWWGHRIPAYLFKLKSSQTIPDSSNQENWIVARTKEQALKIAASKLNTQESEIELIQDEDVLDTWFSSALFPFSTMGWPNIENPDYKAFYPNQILETGWDILFFWVARMVMMGLILIDKLPFTDVFLHPMIRDSQGEKMSKSKGNVIDPLEIIDGCSLDKLVNKILEGNLDKKEQNRAIQLKKKEYPEGFPECGSDALRFGLLAYMQQARNINLDIKRVIGYREFCNKIWQSVKFGLMYIPRENFIYTRNEYFQNPSNLQNLTFLNKWILTRFNQASKNINEAFDKYDFGNATIFFQNFWKYEFCDIYLEAVKPILSSKNNNNQNNNAQQQTIFVLFYILESGLRLLHPMMPFISEELYQKLPSFSQKQDSICINPYPEYNTQFEFPIIDNQFNHVNNIAKVVRQLVNNLNLPKSAQPASYIIVLNKNEELKNLIKNEQLLICTLSRVNSIQLIENESEVPKGCVPSAVGGNAIVYVNVKEFLDVKQEISRQQTKLAQAEKMLENQLKKMNIPNYEDKVPENIKAENQEKVTNLNSEIKLLQETIEVLKQF